MDKVATIASVLYAIDPINTSCNVNGLYDEYLPEARELAELELREDTIVEVFDGWFWEGCLKPGVALEIKKQIERALEGV